MAVPGPVTSQQSVGTHEAIRDGKAILVALGSDVVAALGGLEIPRSSPTRPGDGDTAFDALTSEQAWVLDALDWTTPLDIPGVARRAGLGRVPTERALRVLAEGGWAAAAGSGRWLLARRADLEQPKLPRTVGE
jgi:DNA processing protein